MRHSPIQRLAAGFLAALYLLGGAEHWLGVDPCPHHDAAFFAAGIVDAGDAHGAHHAHHGTADASDSGSEADDHGPCACIGPCATPSPTALPSSVTHVVAAAFEQVESSPAPARDFVAPQYTPFLLPYAHGPPSLA
jgi:hypothetical protein